MEQALIIGELHKGPEKVDFGGKGTTIKFVDNLDSFKK